VVTAHGPWVSWTPYDPVVRRLAGPVIDRAGILHACVLVAGFLVAAAVGFVLVRPIAASPVGYDTAGSVLYFQRIVHGQLLEQPYGATPKAAMTVIDGLLFALFGWAGISLAAVAASAAVVTLGAELVRRVAGPAAGIFAFIALLGSQPLLLDESLAYAVSWASLFLLFAAFAVRSERPRYAVIGVCLGIATLCRLEAVVVLVGAVGVVAGWALLGTRLGTRLGNRVGVQAMPRRAWLVALGLLAIPIMLLHDWLLIRNPFYWASVSANYSARAGDTLRSPVEIVLWLARHYAGMPLLLVLACLGAVLLVRRREYGVALGLALTGPGIGVLLVVMAGRGTYVSARYAYLMDLAVTIVAAIGFATVRVPEVSGTFRRHARAGTVFALGMSVVVATAASTPFALLDPATRRSVATQRTVAQNIRAVEPLIRKDLQSGGTASGSGPILIAPGLWTPRLIVGLRLLIPDVAVPKFDASGDSYAAGLLRAGQIVYHDRVGDPANGVATAMEAGGPVRAGAYTLIPEASDEAAGWWLFRVAAGS